MLDPDSKDSSEPKHHAIAGALSGMVEYSLMYPVDFLKTRMQTLKPRPETLHESIMTGIKRIVREEGALKFFRGMTTPFLTSIPAHAISYVTYEKMKRVLSGTEGGYENPFAQGIAGAIAIINHNIVMNPADVVKQRMQVYNSSYRSSTECFLKILRTEGGKAFYRSLPTQMAIDAPYGALHFIVYEYCQNVSNPSRIFDAKSHIMSGAVAAGIASAATTPLDVCRTLLNTQEQGLVLGANHSLIRGLPMAARVVYRTHGIPGFFRGLTARALHHMPSAALCWIVYEFFKRYFQKIEKESFKSDE